MCFISSVKMVSASSQSTLEKLQSAFDKQNTYFNSHALKNMGGDELEQYVSIRNACVHYVKGFHVFFNTKPDVFATALGILDTFLWKVKVTDKHMSIVSAACFLLACKIKEEEEVVPSPHHLSRFSVNLWTPNDLCRMEMHILDKLNWTPSTVTYLDFLPLLADLYGVNTDDLCCDSQILLAERYISWNSTVLMKPLALAFSLFQHVMEDGSGRGGCTTKLCQLDIKDFDKEMLLHLSSPTKASLHCPSSARRSVAFPTKLFDKPSEIGSTCLPTINEE